jgi:hypothetical protein
MAKTTEMKVRVLNKIPVPSRLLLSPFFESSCHYVGPSHWLLPAFTFNLISLVVPHCQLQMAQVFRFEVVEVEAAVGEGLGWVMEAQRIKGEKVTVPLVGV